MSIFLALSNVKYRWCHSGASHGSVRLTLKGLSSGRFEREKAKSPSLTCTCPGIMSRFISTLAGLMSQWTMPGRILVACSSEACRKRHDQQYHADEACLAPWPPRSALLAKVATQHPPHKRTKTTQTKTRPSKTKQHTQGRAPVAHRRS